MRAGTARDSLRQAVETMLPCGARAVRGACAARAPVPGTHGKSPSMLRLGRGLMSATGVAITHVVLKRSASRTSCGKRALNEGVNTVHPRRFIVQAWHNARPFHPLHEGLTEFDFKFFLLETVHHEGWSHHGHVCDPALGQIHHRRSRGRRQPLTGPSRLWRTGTNGPRATRAPQPRPSWSCAVVRIALALSNRRSHSSCPPSDNVSAWTACLTWDSGGRGRKTECARRRPPLHEGLQPTVPRILVRPSGPNGARWAPGHLTEHLLGLSHGAAGGGFGMLRNIGASSSSTPSARGFQALLHAGHTVSKRMRHGEVTLTLLQGGDHVRVDGKGP